MRECCPCVSVRAPCEHVWPDFKLRAGSAVTDLPLNPLVWKNVLERVAGLDLTKELEGPITSLALAIATDPGHMFGGIVSSGNRSLGSM